MTLGRHGCGGKTGVSQSVPQRRRALESRLTHSPVGTRTPPAAGSAGGRTESEHGQETRSGHGSSSAEELHTHGAGAEAETFLLLLGVTQTRLGGVSLPVPVAEQTAALQLDTKRNA